MSSTATRPDTSYLLRKLHSFTGILPVGAFLAEHFWSNSAALVSPEKYNTVSQELQTIPFRLIVEWGAIFLPMLFHGGYGIYIWLRGNRMSRRIRGWEIALCDAAIHGADRICLYWLASLYGALADAWQVDICERRRGHAESVYLAFFAVGVLASSFHLGAGIWNFFVQVGTGGYRQGAAGGGPIWRAGRSGVQRRGKS